MTTVTAVSGEPVRPSAYQAAVDVLCDAYGRDKRVVRGLRRPIHMAEFIEDSIILQGLTGPSSAIKDVDFSAPVTSAGVALQGWELEFNTASPVAHRVDEMRATALIVPPVPVPGFPNRVRWQADINLKDASGGDTYNASVRALIISD